MTRWVTIHGDNEQGYEAARKGVYQPHPDQVIAWRPNYIVLKSVGYSSNPGSRHSGLRSYYPPEIEVFEIVSRKGKELEVKHVISWSAGKGANAEHVTAPPENVETGT